jgi:hypothetical protein
MMKKLICTILVLLLLLCGCSRDPAPEKTEVTFACASRVQKYAVESTGYYLLEVWGAQGGSCNQNTEAGYIFATGGLGGYSKGYIKLEKGMTLYVVVGGAGGNYDPVEKVGSGGYNGGGYAQKNRSVNHIHGGGGGATHIATADGLLTNLITKKDSVLLVAGGGGGARLQKNVNNPAARFGNGGDGGGENGSLGQFRGVAVQDTDEAYLYESWAATQNTGFAFGKGEDCTSGQAGGGGGWYGGYSGDTSGLGSGCGGSGHLGDVERGTMESGVREGNGLARITWVGYSLPKE